MENFSIKNSISDNTLVNLAIKGNQDALNNLVNRYLKLVYSVVFQYIKNMDEADDISQEVFVKIWKNLKKFDQDKKLGNWIYEIAKNTSLDYLKKKRDVPFSHWQSQLANNDLEQNIIDPLQSPVELMNAKLLSENIDLSLNNLSTSNKEIFNLYRSGFNFREISELKNQSINTIKSKYRRILAVIRTGISK